MADPITLDQVQAILNPEQRAFLETHTKAAAEAAVEKFKTEADAARQKAVPETYELKFSADSPLDPQADKDKVVAYLKANGFSNEQALAHVQHLEETARAVAQRTQKSQEDKLVAEQAQRLEEMGRQFKAALAADPDIGGARLVDARADVERAYAWAARRSPGLQRAIADIKKDVGETIINDYPPWIKLMAEIGKATREPNIIGGNGNMSRAPATLAEALYSKKPAT